ncbi:hypothetical protein BG003_003410 [Podila horticola]|nr:hypothetical protein BG003_003410 [Podila horticola]
MTRSSSDLSQSTASSQQIAPSSSAPAISTIHKSKAKNRKSQIDVKLEQQHNAALSPDMLHGLQGIFKNPDNLVNRLIVALEAVAHAKPSPFEPNGEIYWLLLADALKVKGELFANLESYDLVRTVVAKMAHIQDSPERLNKARERLGYGRKPISETERVDELLWTLLLLRTRQEKRIPPTPRSDSVPAASSSQASVSRPTNDLTTQKAASQEKTASRSMSTTTPGPDSSPAISPQAPVTRPTIGVAAQKAAPQEKATSSTRNNGQPRPCDHEQEMYLGGNEQDLQGTKGAHSSAGEVIESQVLDRQEQDTIITEKTLVPQGIEGFTNEGEVFKDRAENLQEQLIKFMERQRKAAQRLGTAQPKSHQHTQLASAPAPQGYRPRPQALSPAHHRPGQTGKYQEHEQRSLGPRLSSQGGAFVSGPPSCSLAVHEASSAPSMNGSRKRASSSRSTPFSSPAPQYANGDIDVSQSIHAIPETARKTRRGSHGSQRSSLEVGPDVAAINDGEPPAKCARWLSLPIEPWSFSVKDRVRPGPDAKGLGSTSGATSYPYQQPIIPLNEPIKNTSAPLTQGSDDLLQSHIRQSQEKLDQFLQYVADQGALRDGQVSNVARDISHLKSNIEALASEVTALRATNTMVVQSMSMMMEENQRLRETVNELIHKFDSSK